MCEQHVDPNSLKVADDPESEYKALKSLLKAGTDEDDRGEGEEDEEDDEGPYP